MVREHGAEYASHWVAIDSIAAKLGCTSETLRRWVRRAEPPHLVDRRFTATRPNQLWVSDFTYVAAWQASFTPRSSSTGSLDGSSGWRVSALLRTDFVLGALEQAIDAGCGDAPPGSSISDRGTQYLSMHYTHRLADAAIAPSVGRRGDSYDHAPAELNSLGELVVGSWKVGS